MTYSTIEMLRSAVAPGVYDGDEPPATKTNSAADLPNEQLADAIAEADATIDAAISGRYKTPVGSTSGIALAPVKFWSRNIAAYLATCTYRRSVDFTDNDPIYRRFLWTQQQLSDVSKGNLTLPLPTNDDPDTRGGGAGAPINPYAGRLFDGGDLDLAPSWGARWPYDGHVGAVVNALEQPTELFDLALEGLRAREEG